MLNEHELTNEPKRVFTIESNDWESFLMELSKRIKLNVAIKTIEQ